MGGTGSSQSLEPSRLTDPVLGTFTYEGGDWKASEQTWCGAVLAAGEIAIESCGGDVAKRDVCLAAMRELMSNSESVDARARKLACEKFLSIANEWKQEQDGGGEPITADGFQSRLKLTRMSIRPSEEDRVCLMYGLSLIHI